MTLPAPPDGQLRLTSYNIQKCVGMDLRRQPRRTLMVLKSMRTDIAVLQEADKRLPPRPAALPHFVLEEAGWQVADLGGAGSLGWHGNAVIWQGADIKITDTNHISLPGLEPRGAVSVSFETSMGPLRVVGMHLGLLTAYRHRQVKHLANEMACWRDMPTVWAGDFNEWSTQPVLERLAQKLHWLPPRNSFPSPQPMGPLDRIAFSPGLMATNHGVYRDRPAKIASDHLPVWADLSRG